MQFSIPLFSKYHHAQRAAVANGNVISLPGIWTLQQDLLSMWKCSWKSIRFKCFPQNQISFVALAAWTMLASANILAARFCMTNKSADSQSEPKLCGLRLTLALVILL